MKPSMLLAAVIVATTLAAPLAAQDKPVKVNIDNFSRAETDEQFDRFLTQAGVNQWHHFRQVTPIDKQTVIRINRDTLYSQAIVDISKGATLTIPDMGNRYFSVMVVNQDHYINRVIKKPGIHKLTVEEFDTPYILVAPRIFLDPNNPDDVAMVHSLQDQLKIEAESPKPFTHPKYDQESLKATRAALEELGKGLTGREKQFGSKREVTETRHLIGTATGWGGLPTSEAIYINRVPGLPGNGEYKITLDRVPVDAFWSISVYNSKGYFQKNEFDSYSINSVTGTPNRDGSYTVHFGGCADKRVNCLPIMDGWEYQLRLYRPRKAITDGTWVYPELKEGK